MPGTTRYSATFDRPYEEEDRATQQPPPNARRSRSASWQANSGLDGRPYTPLGGRPPNQRSSSTDNGPNKGPEHIPTRTVANAAVKAHNNPFQFVKVGTCPLYKKAEEQLKKAKEVKKPDVLKEEEEEWQSNLDSWKSRRRKMSEDVFRRQEEIKQLEIEEQIAQLTQKKTKTFSEMVESRAHRGRTLSLCLLSSPMELQNWEMETNKNGSAFSGSEENSTVNSEDEGISFKGLLEKSSQNGTRNNNFRTNGENHNKKDNSKIENHNGDYDKFSNLTNNIKSKEGVYIDSGLESISSSHRAGDTPDSGSDFSQDSGSSIDCESPRTGVNILDDFSTKTAQISQDQEITVKLCLNERGQDFGFTFHVGKNEDQVIVSSILEGSKAESAGICLGDQIITIDGKNLTFFKHRDIAALIQKARDKGEVKLLLWRKAKPTVNGARNGFSVENHSVQVPVKSNQVEHHNGISDSSKQEKSVESENEMYVDDFEELKRQSQLVFSKEKPVKSKIAQGVYALNVSSASPISKKELPLNSLFPLSPVTELPSPVDGKTIVSTLSENLPPVKQKDNQSADKIKEVQNRTPSFKKENNTVHSTKSNKLDTNVNGAASPNDLKVETVTVPLPTVTKNKVEKALPEIPVEEKPKPNLIKRKVKVKKEKDNFPTGTTEAVSNGIPSRPSSNDTGSKSTAKYETSTSSTNNPTVIKAVETVQDEKQIFVLRKPKPKLNKENDILSNGATERVSDAKSPSNSKTSLLCNDAGNKSSVKYDAKNETSSSSSTNSTTVKPTETLQSEKQTFGIWKPMAKVNKEKGNLSNGATETIASAKSAVNSKTPLLCNDTGNKSTAKSETSNASTINSMTTKPVGASPDEKQTVTLKNPKAKTNKEKDNLSTGTTEMCSAAKSASSNKTSLIYNDTGSKSTAKYDVKNGTPNSSPNKSIKIEPVEAIQDEKQTVLLKRPKAKPNKNANCQKANLPAKQIEEFTNTNDSLNIVFHSEPKNTNSENESNKLKNSEIASDMKGSLIDLSPDILPVEKIAEEMEKLILEQLEEEERAKELSAEIQMKTAVGSPDHLLTAPPKCAEPPKEKPPPPPAAAATASDGNSKDPSLKRVNSTKRIKKEIHKRRSNFLGIENADENVACSEPSIPPPPALEEILKAEMELDRQTRLQIENASSKRLSLEENELMQKEREIIETLESEERQKQLLNTTEDLTLLSSNANGIAEDNAQTMQNKRQVLERSGMENNEQQFILSEEKQLKEREEFVRQQEVKTISEPSLSVTEIVPNNSVPSLPSLSADTQPLSSNNGDGKSLTTNSASELSEPKTASDEKKIPEKPAVPPKPLKKKEAIRRERERLRQEQEALQREREEHRRKLLQEQEELMKHQKSHAPDAPVPRLGPLPPLVQPNFPPQLTSTANVSPNARENASHPSRSHHGVAAGNTSTAELMGPPVVRQRVPRTRAAAQNEAWGQQKMPSVRKQNQDSLTESRYNQNHWLIQEAEMRRITELKERQRPPGSQTHLAEDDVCSNTPRVPVITPTHNQHLNFAVQDVWNYAAQSNLPVKKYPPPVVKDQLHTVYPREPVSQQPPTKPSRVVPIERPEQMLSVSGRKRCSHCNEELGRGAAMIIESLQLYYHIHCFQCCVCQAQLGNGSCGTDVRVRNNKLHCHNCYSNDEAGLKFSQV